VAPASGGERGLSGFYPTASGFSSMPPVNPISRASILRPWSTGSPSAWPRLIPPLRFCRRTGWLCPAACTHRATTRSVARRVDGRTRDPGVAACLQYDRRLATASGRHAKPFSRARSWTGSCTRTRSTA